MKQCCARIVAFLCLLALGLGMLTASAQEALTLVAPRKAVDIGEWVDLSTWVKTGSATQWRSSNAAVLKVETDGTATGQKRGEVTLTAYGVGDQTATCTVTVGYYTGIDVSYAQTVDWDVLAGQGMDFAMLRSSYGWYDEVLDKDQPFDYQLDEKFKDNSAGAKRVGIPYGMYHYSYAASVAEAHKEAAYLLELLNRAGVTPADVKLPVAYDVEQNSTNFPVLDTLRAMGKTKATQVVLAFCQDLQAAGFRTALYTSKSYFLDLFDLKMLTEAGVRLWMAWYPDEEELDLLNPPTLNGYAPFMWQYTEKGKVKGVTRLSSDPAVRDTVDLNALYMSEMMLHRPAEKPEPTPDPEPVPSKLGDVDGDGTVAAADALMALQYATQKITLTEAQITAADVDGQAGVTAADALMILQVSTQKISGFSTTT